jgi:hypothetical protein
MSQDSGRQPPAAHAAGESERLTLQVDPDIYRAFHRCVWIIVHETGKDRVEIMNEMVRDFLIKHGC